jgi:hypothetical protein
MIAPSPSPLRERVGVRVRGFNLKSLPAGPLPTDRQAVPTEGGAGKYNLKRSEGGNV